MYAGAAKRAAWEEIADPFVRAAPSHPYLFAVPFIFIVYVCMYAGKEVFAAAELLGEAAELNFLCLLICQRTCVCVRQAVEFC